MSERKILLVGGAGYIGSVLTGHFLERGHRVRSLDLLLYANHSCVLPFLGSDRYEFLHGDFADKNLLSRALDQVTDVVILAGLVGDPITRKYPEASRAINDEGLLSLIRSLSGHRLQRVVFISTCSNYGLMPEGVLAEETSELRPLSAYAEAKVRLEKELLSLNGKTDYAPVILRFATAFGLSPRMRFDLTVSEFAFRLFGNEELTVYDADTWRPYCHVRDFARAIELAIEAPESRVAFQVFNAGGDVNNCTKKMIVDEVVKRLPGARVHFKAEGQDRRNYKVSFAKIKKTLGFEPRFTVAQGIEELLTALKQGFFTDYVARKNFYGNYEIHYPAPQGVRPL